MTSSVLERSITREENNILQCLTGGQPSSIESGSIFDIEFSQDPISGKFPIITIAHTQELNFITALSDDGKVNMITNNKNIIWKATSDCGIIFTSTSLFDLYNQWENFCNESRFLMSKEEIEG